MGIIGLPNAGKSSLLSILTRARPKIANYPFTTINPNLGVSFYDDKELTLADIPGLIEGAHQGTGLGYKFLRHIERCKNILHLIDISNEDIFKSYMQVKDEIRKFDKKIEKKKEIIVLNKTDLLSEEEINNKIEKIKKKIKKKILTISIMKNSGLNNLKQVLIENVSG